MTQEYPHFSKIQTVLSITMIDAMKKYETHGSKCNVVGSFLARPSDERTAQDTMKYPWCFAPG
ncbi:MAG: hypothetical protein JSV47_06575 [Deltaproteobacteria bacterium]|jgi:hypothetical protein|nr:MAG: hypothetical protein JSV47_06575 [Deltaproteobacteria bacterium]